MGIPFSRLKFYQTGGRGVVQAVVFFENHFGALVIQGGGARSSRRNDTYEVTVLAAIRPHARGDIGYDSGVVTDSPVTGAHGVAADLTRRGVEQVLGEIAALRPRPYDLEGNEFQRFSGDAEVTIASLPNYRAQLQSYDVTIVQGKRSVNVTVNAPLVTEAYSETSRRIDAIARRALEQAVEDGEIDRNTLDEDRRGIVVSQ